MDRELAAFDITAKQWFLTAVIAELFDGPPTIKEGLYYEVSKMD